MWPGPEVLRIVESKSSNPSPSHCRCMFSQEVNDTPIEIAELDSKFIVRPMNVPDDTTRDSPNDVGVYWDSNTSVFRRMNTNEIISVPHWDCWKSVVSNTATAQYRASVTWNPFLRKY